MTRWKFKLENRLIQIASSFLKLGLTAFGGPAAAYAMMRQEFVERRKWLSENQYFEFLGLANLIPGPNATELAMLIGHYYAEWGGLIVAGISYIFPAMLIVLILSWTYVHFGSLPELSGVLYGIKPVISAILISAIWQMIKPRIKKVLGLLMAVVVLIAYLFGVSPFFLLIAGGISFAFIQYIKENKNKSGTLLTLIPFSAQYLMKTDSHIPYNIFRLFWVFLKAGALMYGSGYVLLAFIYDDLVIRLGWLTSDQIVDAIAIGQFTPGPLATTATFVGYLLGGVPAGLLATMAMFLPSFVVTLTLITLLKKLNVSNKLEVLLEGVSFAALGLMGGVTWELIGAAIIDPMTAVLGLTALLLLIWRNVGAPWLVLGGGLIGLIKVFVGV
jgi:chromate transporter